MLVDLPNALLLSVCLAAPLAACDLARLLRTASHFRQKLSSGGSVVETAAQAILCAVGEPAWCCAHGWRIYPRDSDTKERDWLYLLHLLDTRLQPLKLVAAGGAHTLVASRGEVYAFGADESSQLGGAALHLPALHPSRPVHPFLFGATPAWP